MEKINIRTAIGNLWQNNRTASDQRMSLKEIDVIEKREEVSSSVLAVKKQNLVWKCCKIVGGLRFNPFHGVVKRVDKVIGQIDEGLGIGREGLQVGREGLTWFKVFVGLFGVSVVCSIGNLIVSRRQINPPPPPPHQ